MARVKRWILLPLLVLPIRAWSATGSADEMRQQAGDCARCHVISVAEWGCSRHWPRGAGCVDCHGASQGHVRDERNNVKPDRTPRGRDITPLCLGCHEEGCPDSKEKESCQKCHHVHALVDPRKAPVLRDDRLEELEARWRRYEQRMSEGEHLAASRQWEAARAAFARALTEKPGDRDAQSRIQMCRFRLKPELAGFEIVGAERDESTGLPREVRVAGLGIPMRLVPGGEFELGSDRFANTRPAHQVRIEPFYLARHEVTQEEWTAVLGANPSAHQGEAFPQHKSLPVECVSWEDARGFAEVLNTRVPGGGFRLPSEAEWEYAARQGGETGEAFSLSAPRPVERGGPNRLGLFDLAGNVREWCADIYAPYPWREDRDTPASPARVLRVLRGGAFPDPSDWYDPAMRHSERPDRRMLSNGFRLARDVPRTNETEPPSPASPTHRNAKAAPAATHPLAGTEREIGAAIRLEDLWEGSPVTRDLLHEFRVYKRRELPNHLHEQLRLYLVRPPPGSFPAPRPAVVFIHGGGWGSGNPDQWFPQSRYFALRGAVGVCVQYRLARDTDTPAICFSDCKSAIRYLRVHASELGVNPNQIAVVGESAGGHLAAALGTVSGFDDPGDDLRVSARPDALVLLNPITDLTTRWGESLGANARALSPLHHISTNTPSTLLVHGTADSVVDIHHSRAFLQAMRACGSAARLVELPGADHAFAVFGYGPARFNAEAIILIDRFLAELGYIQGKPTLQEPRL
jgi:formylglycine-generating enzyme required for sulfatase activity/acetyl esterase/lipase